MFITKLTRLSRIALPKGKRGNEIPLSCLYAVLKHTLESKMLQFDVYFIFVRCSYCASCNFVIQTLCTVMAGNWNQVVSEGWFDSSTVFAQDQVCFQLAMMLFSASLVFMVTFLPCHAGWLRNTGLHKLNYWHLSVFHILQVFVYLCKIDIRTMFPSRELHVMKCSRRRRTNKMVDLKYRIVTPLKLHFATLICMYVHIQRVFSGRVKQRFVQ